MDVHPDELRLGERDAFARYYGLFRAPVYNLVRRLLHNDEDAVLATERVFTTAYRRILLHDDGVELREVTYKAALDVCRERLEERESDSGAVPGAAIGGEWRERSDLGRRAGQALETLPSRYQAALLLHDVNGLRPAEMAHVFDVTAAAAGALLFRAREEFRRAFDGQSSARRGAKCRLAEQTAVGAVGRDLPDNERRRLDEHAGYCRHCRRTMKAWGGGALSLALFLEDAPLPQELETTPVFGTAMAIIGASSAVAGSGTLTRALALVGRSLTSRAAAYALAAACLALSAGLALHHSPGAQTFIVVSATGPNVARSALQATRVVHPPIGGSNPSVESSARVATRSPAATSQRVVPRFSSAASQRVATRSPIATSTRSTTAAPESGATYSGAVAPVVTVVADVGGSPSSGPAPAGTPAPAGHAGASSTEAPHAVTPEGAAKNGVKATNDGHVSADRGRSTRANGSHSQSPKHAEGRGRAHGGERHTHKQSRKTH